jgi:hypothetical protein
MKQGVAGKQLKELIARIAKDTGSITTQKPVIEKNGHI